MRRQLQQSYSNPGPSLSYIFLESFYLPREGTIYPSIYSSRGGTIYPSISFSTFYLEVLSEGTIEGLYLSIQREVSIYRRTLFIYLSGLSFYGRVLSIYLEGTIFLFIEGLYLFIQRGLSIFLQKGFVYLFSGDYLSI